MVELTDKPIDVQQMINRVSSEKAGALALFIGTVRNMTDGKRVVKLDFEAYDKMAISELEKIVNRAKEQWPIKNISVIHRIGELRISDIAVVIAVSSPHRKEAFRACEFVIDTLKETVPIWKKEFFEDKEVWVSAHP
ncbi:molybdenum cofactor biosynthesis protein MoaE [Aliifodinibius salicampi]|uniref:Molybdopterin synthase catalytic subunit n=1 Tax=Fodinibius salicampi TaxID=1920655 RepID=A0ABT3Q207_9BACT|nr:molybdenum cofactor biosynthesis protein MoaE [Fodinibius salicampi]MCW9714128.1 molybdenum cofactor biosynthesis protein MoaE [Fodinibius salicampi]